jgi:hypothetical protein
MDRKHLAMVASWPELSPISSTRTGTSTTDMTCTDSCWSMSLVPTGAVLRDPSRARWCTTDASAKGGRFREDGMIHSVEKCRIAAGPLATALADRTAQRVSRTTRSAKAEYPCSPTLRWKVKSNAMAAMRPMTISLSSRLRSISHWDCDSVPSNFSELATHVITSLLSPEGDRLATRSAMDANSRT